MNALLNWASREAGGGGGGLGIFPGTPVPRCFRAAGEEPGLEIINFLSLDSAGARA